mgnify:FL=1|tara:strand:+ start:6528 stop:6908 length:381 start_codon:yes stop_codon:yes gene_type:complete
MPRSIESIIDNNRAAEQRRAAGKPIWDWTINIKAILDENPSDISDNHAAMVANRVGALIRECVPANWVDWESEGLDEVLVEIVEGMEALKPNSYDDDEDFSPLEDLNGMLDQLYDWADGKRVWLGK